MLPAIGFLNFAVMQMQLIRAFKIKSHGSNLIVLIEGFYSRIYGNLVHRQTSVITNLLAEVKRHLLTPCKDSNVSTYKKSQLTVGRVQDAKSHLSTMLTTDQHLLS